MVRFRSLDFNRGWLRYGLLSGLILISTLLLSGCGGTGNQGDDAKQPGQPAANAPKVKEPIMFAGLDWDSAAVHNAIARYIIEKGYGYKTEDIPGSTKPMLDGMLRGEVAVTMEIWPDNMPDSYHNAVKDGTVKVLGTNFGDGGQGWYVPTYVIKGDASRGIAPMAPDLKSVSDLPKYWELFKDPEDPTKGRFYDCIAGWQCEKINAQKFAAYGLSDTFNNFLPGSGAALDTSLASAYQQGEAWFGYYWEPTWIMGKFDMTKLAEPAYTKECWDKDKGCGYPVVTVTIDVHKDFYDSAPDLVEFLTKYETTSKLTSQLLSYMQETKSEASAAAENFLKTQEDIWTKWVPADVATKVKASLK